MPTPTYIPLATVTLGSSASSVTFSSIPATFRDLVLVANGASTDAANGNIRIRFNSDSGSNYPFVRMFGSTDGVFSNTATDTSVFDPLGNTSGNGLAIFQIMDYSATDKHKTILSRSNFIGTFVSAKATRWADTAAITTLAITAAAGNLAAGSTFNLYEIAS